VIYNELTLRYFRSADRAGSLGGPGVFRGSAGDRQQGVWVQFDVRPAAGAVAEARFLAFACPHVIAVSDWLTEQAPGRPWSRELPWSVSDLSRRFEVPIEKLGRLLIVEDAWRAAFAAAAEVSGVKDG
jgi:NifU-like protein involved in Fe-S cluster formation